MNDDLKDAGDHPSVKEDLRRAWQGIRLDEGTVLISTGRRISPSGVPKPRRTNHGRGGC